MDLIRQFTSNSDLTGVRPFTMVATSISYAVFILGYVLETFVSLFCESNGKEKEEKAKGYVHLYGKLNASMGKYIYDQLKLWGTECISSTPDVLLDLVDIKSDQKRTSGKAINIASYNYLGFAENVGSQTDKVEESIVLHGLAMSSTRLEFGTHTMHKRLENLVASFLGVEDSLVVGMGFATNTTAIPALVGKGCLVLSDQNNHRSISLGCKIADCVVRTFSHNNMADLEEKLRTAIVGGQPGDRGPWQKILIIVEGIYSMHGTIVKLPEVIQLKRKYNAYLYLDEAHSIGALGATGRGVCEYHNCDPRDVDILMGTFTKSFGAAGGYLAGSKELVDHLRVYAHSSAYAVSMAPPVIQKIVSALTTLMYDHEEACKRLNALSRNSRHFRGRLKQMGFLVHGDEDSPVVLLVTHHVWKMTYFVRMARERGVGIVCVGSPAVPWFQERIRFCLSSAHTEQMLDQVLQVFDELGDKLGMKYNNNAESEHVNAP